MGGPKESGEIRIGIAGAVISSQAALDTLIEMGIPMKLVLALDPECSRGVSGYRDLAQRARELGINSFSFRNINDQEVVEQLKKHGLDYLFVVGLSQLLKKPVMDTVKKGVIGFHPTRLPRGRGRAPLAWLTLLREGGAASLFFIDEQADRGELIVQEPFSVEDEDDAASVYDKACRALVKALNRIGPDLRKGSLAGTPQDHGQASYYARRTPEDGVIDWSLPAEEIDRLVKAATNPHPGAWTFWGNHMIIIWVSRVEKACPGRGTTGQVLHQEGGQMIVQCGSGHLRVISWQFEPPDEGMQIPVHARLGSLPQAEIFHLRQKVALLEQRIKELEEKNNG